MPIFLIPILILIGIFAFTAGGDFIKNIDLPFVDFRLFPEKSAEKAPPKAASPRPSTISQAPSGLSPPFVLNTVITKGPTEDTEISDTNVVTFEFEGFVDPADTTGRITFETKIEGVDPDWKATSSRQRKITLPTGQHEYVFLVRAKLGKEVDPTPAQQGFNIAVSPFFGKVDILSARATTQSTPSRITLKPKLGSEETIDLTSSKLQGRNGSFA